VTSAGVGTGTETGGAENGRRPLPDEEALQSVVVAASEIVLDLAGFVENVVVARSLLDHLREGDREDDEQHQDDANADVDRKERKRLVQAAVLEDFAAEDVDVDHEEQRLQAQRTTTAANDRTPKSAMRFP